MCCVGRCIELAVGGPTAGSPLFTAESDHCTAGEGGPGTGARRPGATYNLALEVDTAHFGVGIEVVSFSNSVLFD